MSNYNSSANYLESTIGSASPARLRLMLIEKAIETCGILATVWKEESAPGANQHSIKLLDLITELLTGVQPGKTESEQELCGRISDLYVFLAKHLVAAEEHSDYQSIHEIKLVLEAEAETWRAVCAQGSTIPSQSSAIISNSSAIAKPHSGNTSASRPVTANTGLNLEG